MLILTSKAFWTLQNFELTRDRIFFNLASSLFLRKLQVGTSTFLLGITAHDDQPLLPRSDVGDNNSCSTVSRITVSLTKRSPQSRIQRTAIDGSFQRADDLCRDLKATVVQPFARLSLVRVKIPCYRGNLGHCNESAPPIEVVDVDDKTKQHIPHMRYFVDCHLHS